MSPRHERKQTGTGAGVAVPATSRPFFDAVVSLTDDVCRTHLGDEYAVLCRDLTATLARKRPSPLMRGRVEMWACAVTYTLGSVNFLFDPSQEPHLQAGELCALFGVSRSGGANRSRDIMRLLRIGPLDTRWMLPSKLGDNPLAWLIVVNGLVIDARGLPREIQQEAHRRGLIPFVPE